MSTIPETVPPLREGQRLTREEFYRRWDAVPKLTRAERIEGVVHTAAAIRHRQHGGPHSDLVIWLGNYRLETPGTDTGDNSTLQIDLDNDPQSDVFLRILPECGGQTRDTPDGYVAGPPELVAEVAAASATHDLGVKKEVYRRSGVREYLVWKTEDAELLWFRLTDGEYLLQEPDTDGIIHSQSFPGLWLDVPALLRRDLSQVIRVMRDGVATNEHKRFVASLRFGDR